MQQERRRAARKPTDLLVNKFIEGMPHAARIVEFSASGCVLEPLLEPRVAQDVVPLEVALPPSLGGTRMWLWARAVRRDGERTAFKFVGLDPIDRAMLSRLVDQAA